MSELIKMGIAKVGVNTPKGILSIDFKLPPVEFPTLKIGDLEWSEFNIDINDGGNGILPPNGSSANVANFGYLYSYSAAIRIRNRINLIYPDWRIPTLTDLTNIYNSAGGLSIAGGNLKSTGTTYWNSPNTGATNSLKFNARGAGYYSSPGYYSFKVWDFIWSTTEYTTPGAKYTLRIDYNSKAVILQGRTYSSPNIYCSLRLVRDI